MHTPDSDDHHTTPGQQIDLLDVLERANHIASMTSLEDLLEQMLELMIDVCGATNGTLYLRDRDARELIFMVIRGNEVDRQLLGTRMQDSVGIVGAAVQHGRPIVIEDLASDPRWYREIQPEESARLRNAITIPLLLQAQAIGAVQIFNFSRLELRLLQLLANRMASEVDKVVLLNKARHTNERLQVLVDILGQIASILDREELLNLLTNSASNLLEAENSSVYMVDSTRDSGAMMLQRSAEGAVLPTAGPHKTGPISPHQGFLARSAVSAPLRARPISLGKERAMREERTIGSLIALNKKHGIFSEEDTQLLGILANQASTVLQIAQLYTDSNQMFLDFIKTLAAAIDAKDPYTRGHSQRVSDVAMAIAKQMELSGDMVRDVQVGSLLHDIGKIGITDAILTKPNHLTPEEYEQMKRHPSIGYRIMYPVNLLRNVLPAIIEHHERLDGTGYPLGLRGDQVSVMGRIVAVADVYDALTTDRPYRKAMDLETTLDYLQKNSGNHFDSTCVQSLIDAVLQDEGLRNTQ